MADSQDKVPLQDDFHSTYNRLPSFGQEETELSKTADPEAGAVGGKKPLLAIVNHLQVRVFLKILFCYLHACLEFNITDCFLNKNVLSMFFKVKD